MSGASDLPSIAELEEAVIRTALVLSDTKAEAAESIGMPRRTFFRRLKRYGLEDQPAGSMGMGFGMNLPGDGPGLFDVVLKEVSED